jgi:hypothetical protein
MHTEENMEARLWEYIDGFSTTEERSVIEDLVSKDIAWKEKYRELLHVHEAAAGDLLAEPSMRFTKNVMEEIAKYHIAPATKTYIDKRVIWGIGIFFLVLIVGFLVYGFAQIDWHAGGSTKLPVDLDKIDFSKFFSNTYVNIFMMLNVVLGLMLTDRWLAGKRKSWKTH